MSFNLSRPVAPPGAVPAAPPAPPAAAPVAGFVVAGGITTGALSLLHTDSIGNGIDKSNYINPPAATETQKKKMQTATCPMSWPRPVAMHPEAPVRSSRTTMSLHKKTTECWSEVWPCRTHATVHLFHFEFTAGDVGNNTGHVPAPAAAMRAASSFWSSESMEESESPDESAANRKRAAQANQSPDVGKQPAKACRQHPPPPHTQ